MTDIEDALHQIDLTNARHSSAAANNAAAADTATSAQRSQQLEQALLAPDNQVYIVNCCHLVSQMADNVILAAGGLLPLLAQATGGGGADKQQQTTSTDGLDEAPQLLRRLVSLLDALVFGAAHVNLFELEVEKNMSCGGLMRQVLRLVSSFAVFRVVCNVCVCVCV